jgi:hypothetical protein
MREDVGRRRVAHHKATTRLVGFTALLAVGVGGVVLLALQHAWMAAAAFSLVVVPVLIIALAGRARRDRNQAYR